MGVIPSFEDPDIDMLCTFAASFPHVPVVREMFLDSELPGNTCCEAVVPVWPLGSLIKLQIKHGFVMREKKYKHDG
jgi:hypothetical protein